MTDVRSHRLRRTILAVLLSAFATIHSAPPALGDAASDRARTLDRWAREALDQSDATVEDRQRALRNIEEAIRLEPDGAEHWLVMARLREVAHEERLARDAFERAIRLAPDDPEPRLRLAMAWKRQWLRVLEVEALDHAIAQLDTVTSLRPYGSEAWLRLVALHYENGDLPRARLAAARALAGRPRRAETALAAAYVAYRFGEIERADSLFKAAIPRLAPDLRALMEDPSQVLSARAAKDSTGDGGDGAGDGSDGAAARADSAATERETWSRLFDSIDPDPTTAANEVQLECWSRIAHAYFLFYDPMLPGLDARAETFIRYGPPRRVQLNPPGVPLYFKPNVLRRGRDDTFSEYPLDAEVLEYPELGMKVLLHDRSLSGRFTQPVTRDFIPGTAPDPRILARRGDLISLGNGAAIFPTLPPRDQRLEVRGVVSGFESERGPRLLAQARVAGAPGDTLSARWVVLDSTGSEVMRGAQSPQASGCDPAEFRMAEFAADLPAGRFEVAVSVRDTHRRRGVFRQRVTLAPATRAMAVSDLVLCCGEPGMLAGERTVRIEADVEARIAGRRPLVVYFEIYRLTTGADGQSHFEYEYEVHRLADESSEKARKAAARRPPVSTWASREETYPGSMRRQFMTVQTGSLTPGRYRVALHVRDIVAGTLAGRSVEFVRE